MKVSKIVGIHPNDALKFERCGLNTCEDLLEYGGSPFGRAVLYVTTGISAAQILKWVSRADIARIEAIDSRCAMLLEYVGIDTVLELAERGTVDLYEKMCKMNAAKELLTELPTEAAVAKWVEKARGLERKIFY